MPTAKNITIVKLDIILVISRFAFLFCTTLETVTFGEKSQLTKIDEFAFNLCSYLKYITIPGTDIESCLFKMQKSGKSDFCKTITDNNN